MNSTKIYGWIADKQDERDLRLPKMELVNLPTAIDLTPLMPKIYNQQSLGSCTAQGISALIEHRKLLSGVYFNPSRLFIYFNERVMIGSVNEDSGANIRDGIKSINNLGVCEENLCPYVIEDFRLMPSNEAYANGLNHKSIRYGSVYQNQKDLKHTLSIGNPIVFGFLVKESFESELTAKTAIYKPSGKIVGGHAVVLVGYDDNKQSFLVRNSWGKEWGKGGHFWMSYKDVVNKKMCSDFWVIQIIN